METVSYSEIKLFRKCAKAHQYRYRERLKRRRPNRPAFVGTILHEMLDAKAKGLNAWDVYKRYKREYRKLFREEKEEFGDVPAIVKAIYKGYWRRWKDDGLIYTHSEVGFRVGLTNTIELIGYIDAIVEDARRRLLMDHKFHKNIPGPEDRFADIQTVLYYWGWNESHARSERADGLMWDYGRMKAPTIPEVLKNGELSKRANIDTDAFTYREALLANGLREKGYRDILTRLQGKERTFFERVPLPAPPKIMVSSVVADARISALDAKKALRTGKAARSMSGFNCNGCEFRKICESEIRGHDTKFLLKKEYELRPEKVRETKYGEVEEAA